MKFIVFSLLQNIPNQLTGKSQTSNALFHETINQAVLAEKLGFDGYGVGERHGEPFISSSPVPILTAIAIKTSKIRLLSTVTVLSVLDPVRVAEDYATLDHLSSGRLDVMIGKGNDPRHYPLFNIKEEDQWDALKEKYNLLNKLWREENITWSGKYRSHLTNFTAKPRPFQKEIRIWHGSASSEISTDLAAQHNAPIFSSNVFHPIPQYGTLINHYRNRLDYYGFNYKEAIVGAGAGGLYIADSREKAINRYRPYYEAFMNTVASKLNESPFSSLEDHIERGSLLVGTAQDVVDKILQFHDVFGHQVQAIGVAGLSKEEQEEQLVRFATDVIPVLKSKIPNKLWDESKPLIP